VSEPIRPPHIVVERVLGGEDVAVATGLLGGFFAEEGFGLPPGGLAPQVRRYVELDGHAVFVARVDGQQAHDLLAFYTRLGFADRGRRLIEMPLA
jgi:hypothetical protein